ncbi:MAG: hypothetical protein JNK94_10380 [Hyphomonadaceae bacterium]|nr:hypothetical protein [Hyphomonadaceae bacterium]
MNRLIAATLLGGLAAGSLDILYAFAAYGPLSYGLTPEQVLHSVAAGLVGREAARAGGIGAAALGLGLHFLIATLMAAVFVLAAARLRWLTSHAVLWGLIYGFVLYVAMNYVVVPLSAAGANGHFAASIAEASARLGEAFSAIRPRQDPRFPWMLVATIGTHTLLVGVPIALIAKHCRVGQSA